MKFSRILIGVMIIFILLNIALVSATDDSNQIVNSTFEEEQIDMSEGSDELITNSSQNNNTLISSNQKEVINANSNEKISISNSNSELLSASQISKVTNDIDNSELTVKLSYKNIKTYVGYTIIKVTVKSAKTGKLIKSGSVDLDISGVNKIYNAKVKNGIATFLVKLPKAKTYKYRADYCLDTEEYSSTSDHWVYSKIIVKKSPKYFNIKVGKYKIKIDKKTYQKIIKGKYTGKYFKYINAGKKLNTKVYKNKQITKTKKKLYSVSSSNYYRTYDNAWNTPSGYHYSGTLVKKVGNSYKTYIIYQKKTSKPVYVKTKKTPVKICIYSLNGNTYAYSLHAKKIVDGYEYCKYSSDKKIFT